MNQKQLDFRRDLLFAQSPEMFCEESRRILAALQAEDSAESAAGLYLDLRSYLTHWRLDKFVQEGALTRGQIDETADALLALVRAKDTALADEIHKEAGEIAASSMLRLARENESDGSLATFWGHDLCLGLTESLRRGAHFLTSNPAKINGFRKECPEQWAQFVKEVEDANPGISLERKISWLFVKVVSLCARELQPIFEASGGKYGFACVQVSPRNITDSQKMIDEVLFWEEAFRREIGTDTPNIVYKLPAVKDALTVTRELCDRGLRTCLTLDFTYTQHEAFAEIIQNSKAKEGFVVLMCGFLDDAVAPQLEEAGVENAAQISRHASEAVIRKSYANIIKKCGKVAIMGAAIRGDWTIRNCISGDKNFPMCFTTVKEKILEFDSTPRELRTLTNDPVPQEILDQLEKSDIFRKAYHPELFSMDDIADYIPLKNVLGVFMAALEEIEESIV